MGLARGLGMGWLGLLRLGIRLWLGPVESFLVLAAVLVQPVVGLRLSCG